MENQKPDVFVSQSKFCKRTGLSPYHARKLRAQGILPAFGTNPVRIPFNAGTAALTRYATEQGTNPSWRAEQ